MTHAEEIANSYIDLLHYELASAEGCTEPIAIAYAAALCTQTLGGEPESLRASLSGNMIKNARCAVIPNTGGLRGMKAAAVAGAVGGNAEKKLEVLSKIRPEDIRHIKELLGKEYCRVSLLDSEEPLHILIAATRGGDECSVEIKHAHTHVQRIMKNGETIFDNDAMPQTVDEAALYRQLNLDDIFEFAQRVDLARIADLMERQIKLNIAICEEGLRTPYGASIGKLLLETGGGAETRACAYAAAGSDARMSGCPMPVVINSGSGNQGITVTAPVWVYAKHLGVSREKLLRAMLLANLTALYQKRQIGKLSAYCGAVSAACGAGAAISYLCGGTKEQIFNTLSNAVVTTSGLLCDGAKPSCASKIACSVYTAILGHKMAMSGRNFLPGDGLVCESVDQTIQNIGALASQGLVEIDKMMLDLMTD